jgi:hypothetical protein
MSGVEINMDRDELSTKLAELLSTSTDQTLDAWRIGHELTEVLFAAEATTEPVAVGASD